MTDLLGMKAVSIHQPYAGLIATGAKTIETRSYPTKYRGPIVVCSTQKWHPEVGSECHDFGDGLVLWDGWRRNSDTCETSIETALAFRKGLGEPRSLVSFLPKGVALGVADLAGCLPMSSYASDGEDSIVIDGRGGLDVHRYPTNQTTQPGLATDISDQLPRGDFTPGNYGWMLENFKAFDQPIPVKGQQQIWTVKDNNLRAVA